MNSLLLVALYCALIAVASLLGGTVPARLRLDHRKMQLLVSFVAGLMLGISLLHLLPHGAEYAGSLEGAVLWMLAGVLAMFFLIRLFGVHAHGPDAHHEEAHVAPEVSWVALAAGMTLHTVIDGVALAGAVVAETGTAVALAGLGTFLVVFLHKPLDALAITGLMEAAGRPARLRRLVNAGFALTCPAGALLFYAGVQGEPGAVVGAALAFSAGIFACIALADLLPEIQFHSHDRLRLTAMLLLGVGLAWALLLLEHDH